MLQGLPLDIDAFTNTVAASDTKRGKAIGTTSFSVGDTRTVGSIDTGTGTGTAIDIESQRHMAGLGRLFNISHFYQPDIRNKVLPVEKNAESAEVLSRLSHYEAYVGVAGSRLRFRGSDNQSYDLNGYEIQFGARTNDYFGLEFRLGQSDQSAASNRLDGSQVKLDHMISVFARPSLAFADTLRLHTVLGFSSIKRTISGRTQIRQTSSAERDGLSYGVGLQWQWRSHFSLSLDYLNLYDDGDESLQGISFGIAIIHR